MKIVIYKSATLREERVVAGLSRGFDRHGVDYTVIPKPSDPQVPPDTSLAVFIGAKSRKLRDACVRAGVPYILIDKGYFHRGRYHRFSLNGFTPCYLGSGLDDPIRFKNLQVPQYPRRKPDASNVTFIGFDNKYGLFHGLIDAEEYAAKVRSQVEPIISGTSLRWLTRTRADRARAPFSAVLPSCYCVIVHGSIAAVEAVMAGVPVVSLGGREANVVHDLSNEGLESVVNPRLPDGEDVAKRLAELAWCQFNIEEIRQGLAWGVISEQYRRLAA